MISIVTGTLNRGHLLPDLIENTVNSNDKLELVLVDGGSPKETLDYIKDLKHPAIKLIEIGERSSYPHFMNIGIENASHEIICQWNDDVLLINPWTDVFNEIDDENDFYIFNWKYGTKSEMYEDDWINGVGATHPNKGWCICDAFDTIGEIVLNYGLYKKKIFREIGMYHPKFLYYYADGDMSRRAHMFGYKHKSLDHIRVASITQDKLAMMDKNGHGLYHKLFLDYKNRVLDPEIPKLST